MTAASPNRTPYVRLGNAGLKVSRIILGTMQYGNLTWQPWVMGEEKAIKHVEAAYVALFFWHRQILKIPDIPCSVMWTENLWIENMRTSPSKTARQDMYIRISSDIQRQSDLLISTICSNNIEHHVHTEENALWYVLHIFFETWLELWHAVRLGNSGLKVSKIILGTMQYGDTRWQEWVLDEKEAIKHIKAAYEAGIQSFDTANVYSGGESERILGVAIKELQLPRDEIVVMTKLFHAVATENIVSKQKQYDQEGFVNQHGLSRKHIFESVKHSLERLQLDYIDLLQCKRTSSQRPISEVLTQRQGHRFDYNTPIEETMQALHDVVKAGYVRYIGMSSCWAYQFHAMQNYAISHNLTPFISMQNHHSLIYREEEREMFPTLKHFGVGAIPWSPLARGLLTRPVSETSKRGTTDFFVNQYSNGRGTADVIGRVEEVAKKKGIKMAQVALAWSFAKDGVSAPIVGTTSLENLKDLIEAIDVKLTDEEIKYLEEPYQPTNVMGHY
ncbi:hypothetical protein EWM64_g225 [Hericium alpestre]|uniref:NADP-dependent oxidoreductase domain-containing protein n=1 Tax=Hericium alpestre TaxID=135208 RepID=A0A4Z0ABX5_9AGAM|nr:hypothetical protein EWM64_g225 [Hericium alpestre]